METPKLPPLYPKNNGKATLSSPKQKAPSIISPSIPSNQVNKGAPDNRAINGLGGSDKSLERFRKYDAEYSHYLMTRYFKDPLQPLEGPEGILALDCHGWKKKDRVSGVTEGWIPPAGEDPNPFKHYYVTNHTLQGDILDVNNTVEDPAINYSSGVDCFHRYADPVVGSTVRNDKSKGKKPINTIDT